MIGKRKIVSLCISRIQDASSYEYTVALNEKISPQGYSLFVYNTCCSLASNTSTLEAQASVFELIDLEITDVLIVYEETLRSNYITEKLISKAKNLKIPVIVIGGYRPGCICVNFDHIHGFKMISEHIIDVHKTKKFHFIAGSRNDFYSEQRLDVFRNILETHNIPFSEDMVSYCDFCPEPAAKAAEKLISGSRLPEAIVCANDNMAIAVIGVLNRHGIKVPEDVMVTGYDGINEIHFSSPRLTSVLCSYADLADKTAEVINGTLTEKELFVSPKLEVYESCGCLCEKEINTAEYISPLNNRLYRFQKENLELAEISAKIQCCDNFGQIAALMNDRLIYDMCCLLKEECVDESVNPLERRKSNTDTGEHMLLLYDNDGTSPFEPRWFASSDIVPHLDYFMEHNRIFIFTALHYLDIPMGYVCFHFSSCDCGNFMKIPQTVNMLNNALGGYRNLRYKHYLMNKIDKMYSTDLLTGLLNRRGFTSALDKMFRKKRPPFDMTIIMADLDGLKYINDNFGHDEGDAAIKTAADALMYACPPNSLCTRFGGDEMLAVCFGKYDKDKLTAAVNSFLDNFNRGSGKPYKVSVSIGVNYADSGMELSFEELVRKSDMLMYDEKKKRKNTSQ